MKKVFTCFVFLSIFILASCSSGSDLKIDVEKDLYFAMEQPSEFEIKVTEGDEPVKGLEIAAEFDMTQMDHGSYHAEFEERGNGIYGTEIELPMSGEWEIVFTILRDGEEIEKVMEYEVKEAKGVALINGEWVTEEDLDFYRFINKLHIEISKEKDKAQYKGKKLEDRIAYWDRQEEEANNKNALLTQIVRLRAMALLGEEKGHKAGEEEIQEAVQAAREQYEQYDIAKKMIKEFGEDKFWEIEEKQYEKIILSQKVQNDLIERVKKENQDVNEQEIMYLAEKEYEELLVDQVGSLKIQLF